jgi:protein tyrosine phosphatase
VRLIKLSADPASDYINANYIRSWDNKNLKKYICTQGPLPGTVLNFWRMCLVIIIIIMYILCIYLHKVIYNQPNLIGVYT